MIDPALLGVKDWPDEVSFLPYVGRRYLEGFDGRRVLLLGESHYRKEGSTVDAGITRYTFFHSRDIQRHGDSRAEGRREVLR